MKLSLFIICIVIFISLAPLCFSADQWGAYQDELAKEKGVKYLDWIKSIAIIIFKIFVIATIFFTISGYGAGVSLLSLRDMLGTVAGIVVSIWSFVYHDTFMSILEYLTKGVAIIIVTIIVGILLYNGISQAFSRGSNK